MKRVRITAKQYNTILLNEQKNRLISNDELIKEGLKEKVLLGIAMLVGVGLTGFNKANAQSVFNSEEAIKQMMLTLEKEKETKEITKSFSEMGIENPEELLAKNAQQVVDKFNELAKKKDKSYKLPQKVVTDLESLDDELKKGYALKGYDISTDTIDAVNQKKTITIFDTIEIQLGNDTFFETGGYILTDNATSFWNNFIDTLKQNGGKIISAKIESSTDAETMPEFVTSDDKTGNITLAKERTQQMIWILKSLNKDIKITTREIPNNGSDVVSTNMFLKAAKNKQELQNLRNKTSEFRYVKVSFDIEFNKEVVETVKPEEIVKNYRFELFKVMDPDRGRINITTTFKNKKLRCNKKEGKCFTF